MERKSAQSVRLNRQKEIPNKLIRFTLRIIKIRDRRVKRHIISEHVTKWNVCARIKHTYISGLSDGTMEN